VKLAKLRLQVTSGLWFVPVLCVVVGVLLSFGTIAIDRELGYQAIPSDFVGGPEAATVILQTIATSMVSLTALVLTITMVVVQLAMGQFSPRIVQRILQDKPSQFAIGLFVATFVHAILALREVTNDGDGTGQVPGIAVITAFVLVVASIAVLVIYVHLWIASRRGRQGSPASSSRSDSMSLSTRHPVRIARWSSYLHWGHSFRPTHRSSASVASRVILTKTVCKIR